MEIKQRPTKTIPDLPGNRPGFGRSCGHRHRPAGHHRPDHLHRHQRWRNLEIHGWSATWNPKNDGMPSLSMGSVTAGWCLTPQAAPGVLLSPAEGGVEIRNGGASTVELVQSATLKAKQQFALEFQGRSTRQPQSQQNPPSNCVG